MAYLKMTTKHDPKSDPYLAQSFFKLARSAARKKIYSRKAAKEGKPAVAHFLRAMSASEAVQSRRLFNSLIGRVDTSDAYIDSIFVEEVQAILENYSELIDSLPQQRSALLHALRQLRAAETRLYSFYNRDKKNIKADKDALYFVCRFCGYLSTDTPPDKCPLCTASRESFDQID
jgi:rubrerythrin